MRDYNQDWEEFWEEFCSNPDGSINLEQVKKELSDYKLVMEEVSKVYSEITSNLLSKPLYYAKAVLDAHYDYLDRLNEKQVEQKNDEMRRILSRIAWLYERYHKGVDALGEETRDKSCGCLFSHHMGGEIRDIKELGIEPDPQV